MSEPSTQDLPETCPSCGATVRTDVSWCTQCYAPLRPTEPEPGEPRSAEREPAEQESPGVASPEPWPAGETGPDRRRPPATTDPAEVERVAEQMLAQLAVERDEVRGAASRLPSSPGARALLVVLVILAVTAVIVVLMFVVGSLL